MCVYYCKSLLKLMTLWLSWGAGQVAELVRRPIIFLIIGQLLTSSVCRADHLTPCGRSKYNYITANFGSVDTVSIYGWILVKGKYSGLSSVIIRRFEMAAHDHVSRALSALKNPPAVKRVWERSPLPDPNVIAPIEDSHIGGNWLKGEFRMTMEVSVKQTDESLFVASVVHTNFTKGRRGKKSSRVELEQIDILKQGSSADEGDRDQAIIDYLLKQVDRYFLDRLFEKNITNCPK